MRIHLLIIVTSLFLTSCDVIVVKPDQTEAQPTLVSSNLPSLEIRSTAIFTAQSPTELIPKQTVTNVPMETFQPTQPGKIKVYPEQIHKITLCPADADLTIKEIGIPPNLGLLVTDGKVSISSVKEPFPVFIYQPSTGLSGKQLDLSQGKLMQSTPQPSPDGRLISYLQYTEGQPARSLVVQSVNGQVRNVVLEREYPFGYFKWIDKRFIVWNDIPNPEDYWSTGERADTRDYIPTHLIDVNTLQVQELPPIQFPKKDGEYITQNFIRHKNENYAFLQHNTRDQVSFEIYSYTTKTSQPVFDWLPENVLKDPRDTSTYISSNGEVNLIAQDGNFLWLARRANIQQLLTSPGTLVNQIFEFAFPQEISPYFLPYYLEAEDAFLFTHVAQGARDILEPTPENLFRFDVNSRNAYDYCLDIQNTATGMYISPGETFAAMTFYHDARTLLGKKDTVLLNLATGERAILPDYQVFGWVEVLDE